MIETSLRLIDAAEEYKQHLFKKIKKERESIPDIEYPFVEVKNIFKDIEYSPSSGNLLINFEVFKYRKKIAGQKQIDNEIYYKYSDTYRTELKSKSIKIKFKEKDYKLIANHEEKLVRDNYKIILLLLGEVDLYPDSFKKEMLEFYHKERISSFNIKINRKKDYYDSEYSNELKMINIIDKRIQYFSREKNIVVNKIQKLFKRKSKLFFKKPSLFYNLISFGLLNLNRRIWKTSKKLNFLSLKKIEMEQLIKQQISNYQAECLKTASIKNRQMKEINMLEHLKEIEFLQYKFDMSSFSIPFLNLKMPSNPDIKEIELYTHPCKYKNEVVPLQENDGFEEFSLINFEKYQNLQAPGIILFLNHYNTNLIMCPVKDIWYFMTNIINKYDKSHSFYKVCSNVDDMKVKILSPENANDIYNLYLEYKDKVDVTLCC